MFIYLYRSRSGRCIWWNHPSIYINLKATNGWYGSFIHLHRSQNNCTDDPNYHLSMQISKSRLFIQLHKFPNNPIDDQDYSNSQSNPNIHPHAQISTQQHGWSRYSSVYIYLKMINEWSDYSSIYIDLKTMQISIHMHGSQSNHMNDPNI